MRLVKVLFASFLLAGALASANAQAPAPADKSAKPAPSMPGGPGMMGMDMQKMQEQMKTDAGSRWRSCAGRPIRRNGRSSCGAHEDHAGVHGRDARHGRGNDDGRRHGARDDG